MHDPANRICPQRNTSDRVCHMCLYECPSYVLLDIGPCAYLSIPHMSVDGHMMDTHMSVPRISRSQNARSREPDLPAQKDTFVRPLSSECGTYETVKARFCPWFSGEIA